MSIEGQGHFFTIYFPGFVCFVLYLAKISGERLQDHWSSGYNENSIYNNDNNKMVILKPVVDCASVHLFVSFIESRKSNLKTKKPNISYVIATHPYP